MEKLDEFGFIKIGRWRLENNQLKIDLHSHSSQSNLIYSFVCNGEIKYIGKTVHEIQQRLNGYKNPGPTQTTNIRINNIILNRLKKGLEIDIYVLIDNAQLKYRDFKINLAAGIEDSLIAEFNPEWNIAGKMTSSKTERKMRFKTKLPNQIKNEAINAFTVVIGKAYYNDGFFNVRVKHSELFGEDLSKIWIQLGDKSEKVIKGYVNRTANRNGTPRIMVGKEFKYWIQKNFKQGDIFKVHIIKFDFIKLSK